MIIFLFDLTLCQEYSTQKFAASSEIEEDGELAETVTGVQTNHEKHGANAGAVIRRGSAWVISDSPRLPRGWT